MSTAPSDADRTGEPSSAPAERGGESSPAPESPGALRTAGQASSGTPSAPPADDERNGAPGPPSPPGGEGEQQPPSEPADSGRAGRYAAVSHGFYPELDPAALRRSLWLSAFASTLGTIFFTAVQGTVFNFFLADLGLQAKLGFFMGLACLAGFGSLAGSWFESRFGHRKGLFIVICATTRLLWLVIAALPVLWPAWRGPSLEWTLVALILFFFLSQAVGNNAWMSWMADLVPAELLGRYWGLRQVGCAAAAALARLGFGWYLDAHHHFNGYLAVYAFATVLGVADILLFIRVEHRQPPRRPLEGHLLQELAASLASPGLRRLTAVYLLWTLSNCMFGATIFRFMRGHVEMGIFAISAVETTTLAIFTVYSFFWGRFTDAHGHRGALALCLMIQGICPIPYFFAGPGDWYLIGLGFGVSSLGFCGTSLFMYPLLFGYAKRKGHGRAMGMAAFSLLMGLPSFLVFWFTDDYLCPFLAWLTGAPGPEGARVFYGICVIAMSLRYLAAALAWSLPKREEDTEPGVVLRMFMTTNPLRAAANLVRYVTLGVYTGEAGPFARE
jgi:MFS family permease